MTLIMGVLNVTPDSFSDGGRYDDTDAAIAHGELLALRPFRWGSGLIARASLRLVLASRGVDPDLLSCPESGMVSLGRTSYVAAVRGYQSGEPEGVAGWIRWNATVIGFGASAEAPHR